MYVSHVSSRAVTLASTLLALCLPPQLAWADVTHIVQKGHTIEAIAHRYRVSTKAIIDANRNGAIDGPRTAVYCGESVRSDLSSAFQEHAYR